MTAPKHREVGPDRIPTARPAAGVTVKVIAGRVGDVAGPIQQPATDPTYLDLSIRPGAQFVQSLAPDYAGFLYVFEGAVRVGTGPGAKAVQAHELAVLGEGDEIRITGVGAGADGETARAILVAGRPLREAVARYGPFVMSTRRGLERAFAGFPSWRVLGRANADSAVEQC